jgi:hypothetical protein
MSDTNEVGSAQPNGAVGGGQGGSSENAGSAGSQGNQGERRLLGEVKSLKTQLEEAQRRAEDLDMQRMQAEGDKDAQIKALSEKVFQLQTEKKEQDQRHAFSVLGNQLQVEAAKMGCVDTDLFMKATDLKGIPVDPETYRANEENLKMVVEDVKSARPYLFAKAAPNVQDFGQPKAVTNNPAGPDFNSMSRAELQDWLKKNGDKSF